MLRPSNEWFSAPGARVAPKLCAQFNSVLVYRWISKEQGLLLEHEKPFDIQPYQTQKILISAELLLALQDIQNMQESHWKELRIFLDKVFKALSPRPINSRKLLSL